ncbi:MAG: thermonuclease family protein [Gammaproteobacteria bacterium]|nr:thermonuclease family protein [Gammaproteobacteria bacterium]
MVGIVVLLWLITACSSGKNSQSFSAKVDWVADGDTVRLDDGSKVRLLGINTPELAKDGKPAEPLAKEARQFLRQLIDKQTIQIITSKQTYDKYGRLLAYVFHDDTDVQVELLKQGLASVIAIPPNVRMADRYLAAETEARYSEIGIWGNRYFTASPADKIDNSMDGNFKFVTGKVKTISETESNLLLKLSKQFTVAIPHQDWEEYWKGSVNKLSGENIEVRGWVYKVNQQFRIRARHPVMLRILE